MKKILICFILCITLLSSVFFADSVNVKAAALVVPVAGGFMDMVTMVLGVGGVGVVGQNISDSIGDETNFERMKIISQEFAIKYVKSVYYEPKTYVAKNDVVVSTDWSNLSSDIESFTYEDYLAYKMANGTIAYAKNIGEGICNIAKSVIDGTYSFADPIAQNIINEKFFCDTYNGIYHSKTQFRNIYTTSTSHDYWSDYKVISSGKTAIYLTPNNGLFQIISFNNFSGTYSTYNNYTASIGGSNIFYRGFSKNVYCYANGQVSGAYDLKMFPLPVFNSIADVDNYLLTGNDARALNKVGNISTYRIDALPSAIAQWDNSLVSSKAITGAMAAVADIVYPSDVDDEDLPFVVQGALQDAIAKTKPLVDADTDAQTKAVADAVVVVTPDATVNTQNFTKDLTTVFPFCIPFDLMRAVQYLECKGVAPCWKFPFVIDSLDFSYTFVVDMAKFESLAKIMRSCETLLFVGGLIVITRNIVRG